MTKIFIDVDGIVADFTSGVLNYFAVKNFFQEPDYEYDPKRSFGEIEKRVTEEWGGSSKEWFWDQLGYDFWSNLSKTKEADTIIDTLRTLGTDRLCFLTSPCRTSGCMDGKMDWLKKYYPDIPVLLAHAPKHFCANPNSVLIDDNDHNCKGWVEHGGVSILWPRPWNANHQYEDNFVNVFEKYVKGWRNA